MPSIFSLSSFAWMLTFELGLLNLIAFVSMLTNTCLNLALSPKTRRLDLGVNLILFEFSLLSTTIRDWKGTLAHELFVPHNILLGLEAEFEMYLDHSLRV